ncbi:hypothetical protein A33Q_2302 [Indibacter alkaliphilus LW1]|uniref:Uncharacterized protein n=1 Tax=Indibacter alkaliphilus (strain CCUG 57479 / KCTC 22604 / LW1) TaxID=1189612 RepID=S2DBI1_INDAL|nr:hypothetical protein A33Q_2302 [Indibacter alkaliphilus LW1]
MRSTLFPAKICLILTLENLSFWPDGTDIINVRYLIGNRYYYVTADYFIKSG